MILSREIFTTMYWLLEWKDSFGIFCSCAPMDITCYTKQRCYMNEYFINVLKRKRERSITSVILWTQSFNSTCFPQESWSYVFLLLTSWIKVIAASPTGALIRCAHNASTYAYPSCPNLKTRAAVVVLFFFSFFFIGRESEWRHQSALFPSFLSFSPLNIKTVWFGGTYRAAKLDES